MFNKPYHIALAVLATLLALSVPGLAGHSYAAPPTQGLLTFGDPTPTEGALNDTTPEVVYAFDCFQGNPGSVVARTTDGDLRINLTVQDGSGQTIGQGSEARPGVSVVSLFQPTTDGLCTLTLAREGNTSGQYTLRLLPGYDKLDVFDRFDVGESGNLGLLWEPYASQNMTVNIVNKQLQIQVLTENLQAYAVPTVEDGRTWSDFYIQADFTIDGDPSYYEYGFVLRTDETADNFYSVTLSSDGDWNVYWFDGEWNAIQEWTVSPVVDGTDKNPRVSVWVQGNTFRVYFNNQFVGEVSDPNSSRMDGGIGIAASTLKDQPDVLTVYADNLVVTVPAPVNGAPPLPGLSGGTPSAAQPTAAPIGGLLGALGQGNNQPALQPTQAPGSSGPLTLSTWQSDDPQTVVQELQSLGLIPADGSLALTVPSSYHDTSDAGFSYYLLGEGKTFRNFALSFDARLLQGALPSGCGMYFRDTATYNADALVFADGSFLLGQWDAQGQLTDASVLEFSDAVIGGLEATNRVLVIANEEQMTLFVNGQQVAQATFEVHSGPVALEVYVWPDENGQTQQTYCQLNNVWLWEY